VTAIEADIMANPHATEREILALSDVDALHHPNCPPEIWWGCADHYSLEAQSSVLFPLMILENPARWAAIEWVWISDWIKVVCNRLSLQKRELFACDCVERVLFIYERQQLGNSMVRDAINIRRQAALEQVSSFDWGIARLALEKEANRLYATGPEHMVVYAAIDLVAKDASSLAAHAMATNKEDDTLAVAWARAWKEEFRWQWARLQQYARGEL